MPSCEHITKFDHNILQKETAHDQIFSKINCRRSHRYKHIPTWMNDFVVNQVETSHKLSSKYITNTYPFHSFLNDDEYINFLSNIDHTSTP